MTGQIVFRPPTKELQCSALTRYAYYRISTTRLAMEVKEALDSDPLYGPTHDRWRHTVGIEYEVVLEDMLQTLGAS